MKITFNDSQTLQVQSITASGGKLHVSVLRNTCEQLKHLFLDTSATAKIVDDAGNIYENYTVFSYLMEKPGGIYVVEMEQEGKDTATRLAEVEERAAQTEDALQMAIAELTITMASMLGGMENV